MMAALEFVGYWALVALAGAISFGIMVRRIDAEDAERERDEL